MLRRGTKIVHDDTLPEGENSLVVALEPGGYVMEIVTSQGKKELATAVLAFTVPSPMAASDIRASVVASTSGAAFPMLPGARGAPAPAGEPPEMEVPASAKRVSLEDFVAGDDPDDEEQEGEEKE